MRTFGSPQEFLYVRGGESFKLLALALTKVLKAADMLNLMCLWCFVDNGLVSFEVKMGNMRVLLKL